MRDILIKLVDQKQVYGIDNEQQRNHDLLLLGNDELADHLLANGVTVNKLIPVSDEDAERETSEVYGEWIDSHVPGSTLSECSLCHYDCGAWSMKFCPNCGHPMKRNGGTKQSVSEDREMPVGRYDEREICEEKVIEAWNRRVSE